MEELTAAEYAVVLAELSWPGAPDRVRVNASQLSSSTYHVARRRLLAEGWISTVAIPRPSALAIGSVEIAFVRPTLSEREKLLRACGADSDCVALFAGLHSVLGVFFRRDAAEDEGHVDAPRTFACRVSASSGGIPVFLDLSGAWARFGGRARPDRYPSGLVLRGEPATDREQRAIRAAFGPGASKLAESSRSAPATVTAPSVSNGAWVDLPRVPPFEGRRLGEVIYVHGRLRPGSDALRLLSTLTADCSVFPFLFVWEGDRVLLAGLGQTSAAGPGRRPVSAATVPVQPTLIRHLEPVEVMIEPVESHSVRIIHRYGPALSPADGLRQS
jgi:hypothetical protein